MGRGKNVLVLLLIIFVSNFALAGTICESLDIMLLIDRSCSMGDPEHPTSCFDIVGDKMDYEQVAAKNFVDKISNISTENFPNRMGLIIFAAAYWASLSHPIDYVPESQVSLKNAIDSITLKGDTNLGKPIDMAIDHFLSNPREEADDVNSVIILMTDGAPFQGGIVNGEVLSPFEYALNRSEYAKSLGITIYIIGLDMEERQSSHNIIVYPEEVKALLEEMASPGKYYYTPYPENLDGAYQSIAEAIECLCGNDMAQSINNEDCDGTDLNIDPDSTTMTCHEQNSSFLQGIGSLSCHAAGAQNECTFNLANCLVAAKATVIADAPTGVSSSSDVVFQAHAIGETNGIPVNNITNWEIKYKEDSGEETIESVSDSDTDSYLEGHLLNLPNGIYTYSIRGKSIYELWSDWSESKTFTISGLTENAFWMDLGGNVIFSTEKDNVVRMVYHNTSFTSGTKTFEVWRDDLIFDNKIIEGIVGSIDSNGTIVALFLAENYDLDVGDKIYFKSSELKSSENLEIIEGTDNPGVIEILYPSCGSDFRIGEEINITIKAVDPDDAIDGSFKVYKDGGTEPVINEIFENGEYIVFTENFADHGTYKMILEGVDGEGDKIRAITNIIILDPSIDGKYAAACIDEPKDFSNIPSGIVKFNASSTKGINYVDGTKNSIAKSEMLFNWKFSEGSGERTSPYADGSNQLAINFYKIYIPVKGNWATLDVRLKNP
ncbi:MAG: vWA domain-containing protein [Candidatus Pacearchaeota archaeon]